MYFQWLGGEHKLASNWRFLGSSTVRWWNNIPQNEKTHTWACSKLMKFPFRYPGCQKVFVCVWLVWSLLKGISFQVHGQIDLLVQTKMVGIEPGFTHRHSGVAVDFISFHLMVIHCPNDQCFACIPWGQSLKNPSSHKSKALNWNLAIVKLLRLSVVSWAILTLHGQSVHVEFIHAQVFSQWTQKQAGFNYSVCMFDIIDFTDSVSWTWNYLHWLHSHVITIFFVNQSGRPHEKLLLLLPQYHPLCLPHLRIHYKKCQVSQISLFDIVCHETKAGYWQVITCNTMGH